MIQRFWLWCWSGSAGQAARTMILAGFLVFMSACSTGSNPTASSSPSPGPAHTPASALTNLTACMLVSAKEMQQILGIPVLVTETTVNAAIGQTQCEYEDASASGSAISWSAFVKVTTRDHGQLWTALLSRAAHTPAGYQKLSGLGDGAFFQQEDAPAPPFHVLWMLKGSIVVQTWLQE
jgi:hypothetical protein